MSLEIILIGPMRAGKTTLGKMLAEKLNLPQISLDELRWRYYAEQGYKPEVAEQLMLEKDYFGLERYWNNFDPYAIEHLLAEYRNCVFDFGAGHSVYQDAEQFARVRDLLKPYPYVILILPSPDPDESVRILEERTPDFNHQNQALNAYFAQHLHNRELAKFKVFTRDKTPEQSRDEILGLIKA